MQPEKTAIQFNFKVGRDGLMVNVYASDPDEATYLLGYVSDNVDDIVKTQAAFDAANNLLGVGAKNVSSGWQSGGAESAGSSTSGSAPATGGAAPCPHGPRVHRASKPDSASKWSGWFCPANIKECKPVWDPKR